MASPHPPNIKVEWTHNKKIAHLPSTCVHTPTHTPMFPLTPTLLNSSNSHVECNFGNHSQIHFPKVDELGGEEGVCISPKWYICHDLEWGEGLGWVWFLVHLSGYKPYELEWERWVWFLVHQSGYKPYELEWERWVWFLVHQSGICHVFCLE